MQEQPKQHGGARPGAGRPKSKTHARTYQYWLTPEQKEKVDEFVKNLKQLFVISK